MCSSCSWVSDVGWDWDTGNPEMKNRRLLSGSGGWIRETDFVRRISPSAHRMSFLIQPPWGWSPPRLAPSAFAEEFLMSAADYQNTLFQGNLSVCHTLIILGFLVLFLSLAEETGAR